MIPNKIPGPCPVHALSGEPTDLPDHVASLKAFLLDFHGLVEPMMFDLPKSPLATQTALKTSVAGHQPEGHVMPSRERCMEIHGRARQILWTSTSSTASVDWTLFYIQEFVSNMARHRPRDGQIWSIGAGFLVQPVGLHPGHVSEPNSELVALRKLEDEYEGICGRTPAPATGAVLPGLLSSVWLSLNSLPAFETIHSPAERASWQHLLLANVFDKFWIDTPKHLEQVGFDLAAAGGQGDDDPILMERSTGPTDVKLPFFHLLEDRSVRESCRCSLHEPKYPSHSSGSGPASAAALHFLDRLSQVSISDEEAEDGFRSPPPPPVVLVKFVDQFVAIMVATQTSEGKSDKSQRNCTVWRGDMTCLKDVTELTVILNNVATWATTTLRTALSEFVSAWMDRLPPEEPDQDDASDDDDEQGPKEESDVKHCDVEVITAQMGKLRIARTNSGLVQGIQQEQKKQQEDQQQQQQKPRKVDNAALVMSKDGTHKIVVRLPPPNPRDSPPARTAADAALETGGPSAAAAEGRPESSASGASGAAVSAMDASSPASIYSPLPTVFVGLSTATSSPQAALQPPVSIFTTTQSSSPSAADVDFTPAAPTSPGKGGDGKNHLLLAQPRPLTRPRGVSMGSAGVDGAATAAAAASAAAATLSSLQSRAVSDSGDHHYSIVTASQEEGGGGVFVDLPAKRAKIQQRPASFDGRAFDQARWFGGPDGTPHGWDVNSGGHFVVPLNSLGTLKRFRGPQDFDGEVFRFSVEVKAE